MKPIVQITLLTAAFTAATATLAAPILTSATRYVEVGDMNGPAANQSSTSSGFFGETVSETLGGKTVSAGQTTSIDAAAGHFTGSGNASVGFSVLKEAGIYASSFFDVFFDLPIPHTYLLAGLLTSLQDGGSARGEFVLDGPTSLAFAATGGLSVAINDAGTLPPGSYRLLVSAEMDNARDFTPDSFMGGEASFFFNLRLTASAPEPATLALIALALLAISATRVRARRHGDIAST